MNVHYKNVKQLCATTQSWIQTNLSHLGIDSFGCNFIDLKQGTYLPLGNDYKLYCQYIEKKHHLDMASRIQSSVRVWNQSEPLYQFNSAVRGDGKPFHIIDWTIKTDVGFELFVVITHRPLSAEQMIEVKQWMNVFSYHGAHVKKYKPKALIDLEGHDALSEKYETFHLNTTKEQQFKYQKAKFNQVVLTGKEQTYVEHLVMHRTHKEIAARHQVTETAVRHVICNIKRKLGSENMSTTQMFALLNDCGALAACMNAVRHF
jgi:DNA-binding CsgD family transcriptional regulator